MVQQFFFKVCSEEKFENRSTFKKDITHKLS